MVLSCEMHLCMKNSMMLHKLSFMLVFEGSYNVPGYFPRVCFFPFLYIFLTTIYLKRPYSSLERDLSLGSNWKFTYTFLTQLSSNTILNLPPLGQIDRFHNPWNLIHKCDGSCDVIKNLHISNLLPWHGHVLK